jgi:hypothetical protein
MMVSILDQNSVDDIIEQGNQLESDPGQGQDVVEISRSREKTRTTCSCLLRKGRGDDDDDIVEISTSEHLGNIPKSRLSTPSQFLSIHRHKMFSDETKDKINAAVGVGKVSP